MRYHLKELKQLIVCFLCLCLILSISGCNSKSDESGNEEIEISSDSSDATDEEDIGLVEGEKQIQDFDLSEIENNDQILMTTEGYLLRKDGNIVYVDLENPGGRQYPGEGEDRAVAFDMTDADVSGSEEIQSGVTLTITYYVKDDQNIATCVSSDGDEKEPVVNVEKGTVTVIEKGSVQIESEGNIITFDTSEIDVPYSVIAGTYVQVTYYVKDKENIATSISETDIDR